jgi:CCR4-NOT transcription complex subunit 7/8
MKTSVISIELTLRNYYHFSPPLAALPMTALPVTVRDVWERNLEGEVSAITNAFGNCNHCFIAMATNSPGLSPGPLYGSGVLSSYNVMKINVEGTHIIKLGLAIFDANGESLGIWEFNFRDFDLNIHSHNTESIELLKKKGFFFFFFDFQRRNGIDSMEFAKLIMKCGVLDNSHIT